MTTITTRVHVKASSETTFDHLIAFENYPEFVKPVESVERDPEQQNRVKFTWSAAGSQREHRVDVEYDRPNTTLYWNGLDWRDHSGVVEIKELNARRSTLTIRIDLSPAGALDRVTTESGVLRSQLERYLHEFSAYVEEQAGVRPSKEAENYRSPFEKMFDKVFPTDETTRGRH